MMKKKNQKAIDEFLAHADAISDDLLVDAEEMLGTLPFILPVLRERREIFALSALADDRICRPPSLPPKTAELVALAAAAGAGAEHCIKVHITAALKEGASRDEILDTILIAGMIGKTRVLASALRQLGDAIPSGEKDTP